jgi:hypothetical protein
MLRAFNASRVNFDLWPKLRPQQLRVGNQNRKENGQEFTLKIINQPSDIEGKAVNT